MVSWAFWLQVVEFVDDLDVVAFAAFVVPTGGHAILVKLQITHVVWVWMLVEIRWGAP